MRKTVIKVDNDKGHNQTALLRQFSKKVISSGMLKMARGKRYHKRNTSLLSKRRSALGRLDRKREIDLLIKLGKPLPVRGRRR
ncbi:MAG: hypothetical protein A2749_01870 [Parcubacteria group bacterium RIFCSPHIGHO2_01_FULL_45_26]|nr:MAG: hypothetical protein A2749_01870 [Parcubacteria group bacterium RIFCSPHIGHO2_01_FULL_45_26]